MLSGKKVTIRLPRTSKDEEDEIVWVNEKRFIIKKGINVDVPVEVAEILSQRDNMLEVIYEYESKKAK